MVAIIGYMMASVILRYFFKSPTDYLTIVPKIFFIYVCLGAAYAYNQKSFIIVDILYRKFSARKRAAIDLFTSVLFFIFVLALLQVSGGFALPALAKFNFDLGMLIDPARWPITIIFPVGPILLLVAGTVRFIRNIIILVNGEKGVSGEKEKMVVLEAEAK